MTNNNSAINQLIADELLRFPCFGDAKKMKKSADELLSVIQDAYENENLSEDQDMAFEAVLYFHEIIDQFDLRRALTIWDQGDLAVFEQLTSTFRKKKSN